MNLEDKKDKLRCCFCRNPLTHEEITIKDYKGDFVSVWCPGCKNLEKQWGPKFLICCCGSEPKELEIEMAKSEIQNSEFTKKLWQGSVEISDEEREKNKKLVDEIVKEYDKMIKEYNDKGSDKTEVSTLSKKRRRSNTTGF